MNSFKESSLNAPKSGQKKTDVVYENMDLHALIHGRGKAAATGPTQEQILAANLEKEKKKYQELADSASSTINMFREALSQFEDKKKVQESQVTQQVVDLSIHLAQKILEHEVSVKPEILVNAIQSLFQHTEEGPKKVLRLHPQDCEYLKQNVADVKEGKLDSIELLSDPAITRGTCVLEMPNRTLEINPFRRLDVAKGAILSSDLKPEKQASEKQEAEQPEIEKKEKKGKSEKPEAKS